ncbi:hypothetical protein BKA69DRAFT_1080237 [Paraphysoderma sedebokerense]|nr:hypothetical protein BKA69DRAFT_1080237 [Paraphysoderma sedebokerense]
MGIGTRLLWSLLWLAPCVGVAFLAALIESKLIVDLCRTEGVSITLALVQTLGAVLATLTVALLWAGIRKYVSQMHSRALIFGEGILFKDLASWPYLSDFPQVVQMFRSGTVGIWLLCTGFIAVSLGTWSRMSYTVDGIVGRVTTASRIDAPEQSLFAGTVCGAGCLAVSSQSVRSRFEGIAASKTMKMSDGFQAPDGFSGFLPPPSSFAAYVRRIKKSGFIGGRIQCNRQTAKPSNVFFSDRYIRDKIFFTTSLRALIADIPEPTSTPGELNWSATLWQYGGNSTSQDGGSLYGYMVCNVTARIYTLTANALPKQDKWEDASITLERDTRLIFTAGNSTNLKPLLPSCPDCGFVGANDNNYTLALVYGGKVDAIASVQGQYANVGYDGKGVPIPSHAWLDFPYSRLLQTEKDESVFIEKFINRVSVGFSEVNSVPDGISFELETEDRFICVVNRWVVVYVQLALAGIVGFVGAFRVLTSKIRLIDIGPMALLAMGPTPETARQLYEFSASGEDGMHQHERRIVKVVDVTPSNSHDAGHLCLAFIDEGNQKLL